MKNQTLLSVAEDATNLKSNLITPRPWRFKGLDIFGNEPNGFVCSCSGRTANAAFIIRACNSFDEMLALIEKVAKSEIAEGDFIKAINFIEEIQTEAFTIIKKVRGEK